MQLCYLVGAYPWRFASVLCAEAGGIVSRVTTSETSNDCVETKRGDERAR